MKIGPCVTNGGSAAAQVLNFSSIPLENGATDQRIWLLAPSLGMCDFGLLLPRQTRTLARASRDGLIGKSCRQINFVVV